MKSIITLLFIIFLSGCRCSPANKQNKNIPKISSVENLLIFLNDSIDKLNASIILVGSDTLQCKNRKETYEGEEWKIKKCNVKGDLINELLFETNWENKIKITRISLLSGDLSTSFGISIGDKYEDIELRVDTSYKNEYPDGFLFIRDIKVPELYYQMNIDSFPSLQFGINSFDSIPKNVKIEAIVLQ